MLKYLLTFLCIFLASTGCLRAGDTFVDYQNFNHGYCPNCHCSPCQCAGLEEGVAAEAVAEDGEGGVLVAEPAPAAVTAEEAEEEEAATAACEPAVVCATNCGISLWWIGLILAGLATAGAIIVSSNNGHLQRR